MSLRGFRNITRYIFGLQSPQAMNTTNSLTQKELYVTNKLHCSSSCATSTKLVSCSTISSARKPTV